MTDYAAAVLVVFVPAGVLLAAGIYLCRWGD